MRPRPRARLLPLLAPFLLAAPLVADGGIPIDANTFGGLRARAIGPAVMSGRIAALDAVAGEQLVIYVGAASGGVWKSEDAGVTFEPIFDQHRQSIGAVKVDPGNSDVVWVGTGESWVRNSVSVGDGVYKSTDGGETWSHLGLADSERIAAIVIDPDDGDRVLVCATGHAFDANEERGVFRTTDGGEHWEKVLYVDADTGCSDLEIDPQDPRILYAGMWQYRRAPDFFTSGGPGSGLHRSTDGGDTWQRLEDGLPSGELGRIAVAVAPSRPSTVYASVEAERTALYRSDDLGEHWRQTNASDSVQFRPFYFGELKVDPSDRERVYKPGYLLGISIDGGATFSNPISGGSFSASVHPDHHALWINPENPHQMLLGTDGGLYISDSRALTWRHVKSLPISQFYRVSHDLEWPYNVYGGLQDNGSWMGPSRSTAAAGFGQAGIPGSDWENIGSGDGFWAFADPSAPHILYTEYQGGQLSRIDRRFGTAKSIKPYPEEGQPRLRFNWNTPIHLSPNDPATLYYGSQFLHRSRNRGDTWETISPDLTTNDPQRQRQADSGGLTPDNTTAENNTTIYSICESPKNPQVIWVGTDDGKVQVTADGGGTWTDVSANVPAVPAGTWVSTVHASPHDADTAFVTFDGHRSGDMTPWVFVSRDLGSSWQRLTTEGVAGYAWVIRQDPVSPELLFLGTEHGLYLTLDGGRHWARFEENLPPVAVHDIVIHPTEHDLILATHGRGIYIVDDITPLRHLSAETLAEEVALLPSRPAVMALRSARQDFAGDEEFTGESTGNTASIVYYQRKRHLFGDLKAEVFDADGALLATLPGSKRRGLNRLDWPMSLKAPKLPRSNTLVFAFTGPRVPEGSYTVRLTKGKTVLEGTIDLVADPRSPYPQADRALQQETALALYHRLADLTFLADNVNTLREAARERIAALGARDRLARRLDAFADELDTQATTLASNVRGGFFAGGEELRERMANLFGAIAAYDGRPSDSQLQEQANLERDLAAAEGRYQTLIDQQLAALNQGLTGKGLEPLAPPSREAWEAAQERGAAAAGPALAPWLLAGLRQY